jgi:integrase
MRRSGQGERRRAAVKVRDERHDRLVNYRWRHTAISTLLMLGVDVPTVAELTGTSPEMINKHYSHLAAAAEKLVGRKSGRPRMRAQFRLLMTAIPSFLGRPPGHGR